MGYKPTALVLIALSSAIALAQPAAAQQPKAQMPPAGAQKGQTPPAQGEQAQGQPAQQQGPAPARPYKQVSVQFPQPAPDPGFDAFRKQLADVVKKKDRAALGPLVVAQGFFWETGSGDKADKAKSGPDNLAAALQLDEKDSGGWDMLDAASQDGSMEPLLSHQGAMCSPAGPKLDGEAFNEVLKTTQTGPEEWAFPTGAGIEVRAAPQAKAKVADKLGAILIRVMPDDSAPPPQNQQQAAFVRVVMPDGKFGYVSEDAIAPLLFEQLCYLKDGNTWKIAGYVGGDQ